MLGDAREVPDGSVLDTDVCIVGAGPAGITIARELTMSSPSVDVTLLESGGLSFDASAQALNRGYNEGFPYYPLEITRLRFFGGTTNHWDGLCGPFDTIDFEPRDWIADSGWPLRRADLEPFYVRAHELAQIGRFDYEPDGWEVDGKRRLPFDPERIVTGMLQSSPPTRFGTVYREAIEQSANVRALLFANVVEIVAAPDRAQIESVRVATLDGSRFTVRARQFVLAAGTIENARLLLASTAVQSSGLGNEHDLVGRYFAEHIVAPGAIFLPSDPSYELGIYNWRSRSLTIRPSDGAVGVAYLWPTERIQREERLSDVRALIEPITEPLALVASSDALTSLRWLAERELPYRYDREAWQPEDLDFATNLSRIIGGLDELAIFGYRNFFQSTSDFRGHNIVFSIEQAPNPDSRVTLTDERDAFGLPRVKLDWRLNEQDKHTYTRFARILAAEFGAAGVGRLKMISDHPLLGWPATSAGARGGWHQMGTTRMSDDPRTGVVDADCRVHGISNLYIASSSVYPSVGSVNPTLTIIALSLRLSDHLRAIFG
jgi:choline dehydrogenase-like flavoprotein